VGPKTIEKLEAAGITSVEKLADMTPEQLVEIPGIGEKMVEKIHQSVAAYFEALESQAVAPVEPSTEDEAAAESLVTDAGPVGEYSESTKPVDGEASVEQASAEQSPETEETTEADRAAAEAVDESAEKTEGAE
jgi:N utilization substance protein A